MFRKIDDHKRTASVTKTSLVTFWFDDGWETLIDCRMSFRSRAEAEAHLLANGYEAYDPNAELKAMGLVWDGSCYVRPPQ